MTAPLIRLDDFPNGHRGRDVDYIWLEKPLDIFNAAGVQYILGVSPLLLDSGFDVAWLNKHLGPTGAAVMHGFDHGFSWPGDWKKVGVLWGPGGKGEFGDADAATLRAKYDKCDAIMERITRYDPRHFICPFNVYTQPLLDMLGNTRVQWVHGMNEVADSAGLRHLKPGRLSIVLSLSGRSYGRIWDVVNNFEPCGAPVTLHWIYDANTPNWLDGYRQLAKFVQEAGK
jgi:hypothetical protein